MIIFCKIYKNWDNDATIIPKAKSDKEWDMGHWDIPNSNDQYFIKLFRYFLDKSIACFRNYLKILHLVFFPSITTH